MSRINVAVRPRRLRRLLALAGFGAILAGTGVGWAADVHASPETDYLDALNAGGLTIYDASDAIQFGRDICAAVDAGYNGEQVAETVYTTTTYADVPSMAVAEYMVVSAVLSLCPWNYNPAPAASEAPTVVPHQAHPEAPISGGVGGVLE